MNVVSYFILANEFLIIFLCSKIWCKYLWNSDYNAIKACFWKHFLNILFKRNKNFLNSPIRTRSKYFQVTEYILHFTSVYSSKPWYLLSGSSYFLQTRRHNRNFWNCNNTRSPAITSAMPVILVLFFLASADSCVGKFIV